MFCCKDGWLMGLRWVDPTPVKGLMIRLFTVKRSRCFAIENSFICLRTELWLKQLTGILPNESKTRGRVGWGGTPSNGLYRGLCLKWVPFSGLRYISKGRDFTSWSIWKGREICHFGLYKDLKRLQKDFMAVKKSRKFFAFVIYSLYKTSLSTPIPSPPRIEMLSFHNLIRP